MCDLSNFFLTRANILSTCQWRGRVYKVFMTWSWYSALNWLPIYWKGFRVLGIVGPARHSLLELPGTTVWFLFAGYCASLLSGLPSCLWFLWCPKGLQWQLRASWPYKYAFPVPFLHIYIYIFSFCSLSGPDSHSQLLSLYFWMMLGENYKVCLAE